MSPADLRKRFPGDLEREPTLELLREAMNDEIAFDRRERLQIAMALVQLRDKRKVMKTMARLRRALGGK